MMHTDSAPTVNSCVDAVVNSGPKLPHMPRVMVPMSVSVLARNIIAP